MAENKGLKAVLSKAGSAIKDTVSTLEEKAKSIDLDKIKEGAERSFETVKEAASNVKESVENFDVDKAKESVVNATNSGLSAVKKHLEDMAETKRATKEILNRDYLVNDNLSIEDSLKIIYLLMNSDKKITDEETKRFREVKEEFDLDNSLEENALISYCDSIVTNAQGDEYNDYLLDEITNIIIRSKDAEDRIVTKNHLLWNLLVLSYSDGDCINAEKEIIRAVARRLQIEKNVVQEMELAIQTIISINEEKEMINTNNNELDERINVILESIKQLIGD